MKYLIILLIPLMFISCKKDEIQKPQKWYIGEYYSTTFNNQDTVFMTIGESDGELKFVAGDTVDYLYFDVTRYTPEEIELFYDYRPIDGPYGDYGSLFFKVDYKLFYNESQPSVQFLKTNF
jgi:hypothetical protein